MLTTLRQDQAGPRPVIGTCPVRIRLNSMILMFHTCIISPHSFLTNLPPDFLSAVFPPQNNLHISPDTSPDNPSTLPPPLPVKSRDLAPHESPRPGDRPSDSPPPLCRSGTARVSFREPISSSYSVDEDEEENEEELQEDEDNQPDEDEVEGGFGSRLNLQKGIPPQMDLLGEKRLRWLDQKGELWDQTCSFWFVLTVPTLNCLFNHENM